MLFHPTGTSLRAVLLTEGCRGEAGTLRNLEGEPFMALVAPEAKGLASRVVVCRAMTVEIREGRGVGPCKDHILLHLDHLPLETLTERLPGSPEMAKISAGMDVANMPAPIVASCLPQHWWPSNQRQDTGCAQS